MATKTPSSISSTRSDPRLTWWFDHHQSAFLNAADRSISGAIRAAASSTTRATRSCTAFICDVARDRFGFHAPDLDDLVHWSLIIDGAQYPDAQDGGGTRRAGDEADAGDRSGQRLGYRAARSSAGCSSGSWRRLSRSPRSRRCTQPLYRRHVESIDLIQSRARQDDGVVFFDLAGYEIEGYNKFIPYYLFPELDLYGDREPIEFPDEDFGGVESVDAGGAEAQSGDDLRALRRQAATCAGRAGAISARRLCQGLRLRKRMARSRSRQRHRREVRLRKVSVLPTSASDHGRLGQSTSHL